MNGINLRGVNYKKAMQEWTPLLIAKALEAYDRDGGKLTPLAIGRIAIELDFPIKTTFNFLEYAELLPSGTWDRLVDRGWTATKLKQAVAANSSRTSNRDRPNK